MLALVAGVYVLEGFPMGLFADLLPVYWKQTGVPLGTIGALSGLGLAWAAKTLWSPLVQRFGEHRRWIAAGLGTVAFALLIGGHETPSATLLWGSTALLCFASATQDMAIDAYTIHHLVGDLTGVLDALGLEKAVVVGHDWGGLVAWQMALLAPHRVERVVGVNTPFFPRLPSRPTDLMRAAAQGRFHYILYFQEPGVAERELEADVRETLDRLFAPIPRDAVERSRTRSTGVLGRPDGGFLDHLPPGPHGDFLSEADFQVFVDAFTRTGFRGGLNWYRNFDRNWELTAYLKDAKVQQPALMITAELDPVLRPELAAGMEAWVPRLQAIHLVRDCGHWTQQEKPEEVNRLLLDFLADLR